MIQLPKMLPKWLAISMGIALVILGFWIGPRRHFTWRSTLAEVVMFSGVLVFVWGVQYEDLSD